MLEAVNILIVSRVTETTELLQIKTNKNFELYTYFTYKNFL